MCRKFLNPLKINGLQAPEKFKIIKIIKIIK